MCATWDSKQVGGGGINLSWAQMFGAAVAIFVGVVAGHETRAESIRTIYFTASDLSPLINNDVFDILGVARQEQISRSVVFDQDSTPIFTNSNSSHIQVRRSYITFTINIGQFVLSGEPSANVDNTVTVYDGFNNQVDDQVEFQSAVPQTINGSALQLMSVGVGGPFGTYSGTNVPSAAVLNTPNNARRVIISFPGKNARWDTVVYSDTAIVPVPPAILLIVSGIAGLGLVGWRRRNAA